MDATVKRLVGAGLSTLSMVAFAIPGGAPFGVGIMVIDTLFEAFSPDPPYVNPGVRQSDLKAAVDKVKGVLNLADWNTNADTMTYHVLALYQGFHDVYNAVSKVKVDHERLVFLTSNETVKTFIRHMDEYFDMSRAQKPDGILTRLREQRYFLELKGGALGALKPTAQEILDHQIASIGIYTAIGSLTAAYLKTAVFWNWGKELLLALEYQKFCADRDTWDQMTAADQAQSQDINPYKKYKNGSNSTDVTAQDYQPPSWDDWVSKANPNPPPARLKFDDCPANLLIDELQEMLDYCVGTPSQPGFYTTVQAQLNEMDDIVSAGERSLGTAWAQCTQLNSAQMMTAAKLGAQAALDLLLKTQDHGLQNVNGSDMVALGDAIDGWRSAQAGVMFSTHKVTKSDPLNTLTNIATNSYPGQDSATMAQKLLDANSPRVLDPDHPGVTIPDPGVPGITFVGGPPSGSSFDTPITVGTVVKIFDMAAYPYLDNQLQGGAK